MGNALNYLCKNFTNSMVLSMTGYGRGRGSFGDRNIEVEIKSLNGKVTDLRLKLPAAYKEKELPIRNLILSGSHRGKLEAIINLESEDGDTEYGLNKQLFKKYHRELTDLSGELNINNADLIQSILRIPNVIQTPDYEMSNEEWKTICKITEEAIYNLNLFRKEEGRAMEEDLRLRIKEILENLQSIGPHEELRLGNLKDRMLRNMKENDMADQVDPNRFEQEVMYYLERLDIS